VASNPNLAQGMALKGLAHLAEGQQMLAEQRLKIKTPNTVCLHDIRINFTVQLCCTIETIELPCLSSSAV